MRRRAVVLFAALLALTSPALVAALIDYDRQPVSRITDPLLRSILTEMDGTLATLESTVNTFAPAAGTLEGDQLKLNGSTSGTLTIRPGAITTSHTLTMPSAQGAANTFLKNSGSGTLTWNPLFATVNTWSAAQHHIGAFNRVSIDPDAADHAFYVGDPTGVTRYVGFDVANGYWDVSAGFRFWPSGALGTGSNILFQSAALTADRTVTYPNSSGTVTLLAATQTMSAKTLTSGSISVSSGATNVQLQDAAATTKRMSFDLSGMTAAVTNVLKVLGSAARTFTVPNLTGQFVLVGDDPPAVAAGALGKVDLTAQAAAIGSTNLTNGAAAGLYRVSYSIATTTADVTAGTIQFQANYTDVIGATNQPGAALVLTATGRDRGTFVVQLSSGELSYQTNLVGIIGTAAYAIYVRVEFLG